MPVPTRLGRLGAPALTLLALAALAPSVPAPTRAQPQPEGPIVAGDLPSTRQRKIELLCQGARKRFYRAQQAERSKKAAATRPGLAKPGRRVRPAPPVQPPGASRPAAPFEVQSTQVAPTNVRVNNKTGDAASAAQSEQWLALWGNLGLCAWNDGQGFVSGGSRQGVGVTTDGGATWTDLGSPPAPPSAIWSSDPVVGLNEKTGEFYYCGLFDQPSLSRNGVGVVRGTFSGTTFVWDTPRVVRSVSDATDAIDKCWMVADSSSGNLYVSYTHFAVVGITVTDSIVIQRSTNNGLNWGPMITLSTPSSVALYQGSRIAVGPAGEVYVAWYEIGPSTFDFQRIRKSTDQGVSFGAQGTVCQFYDNYGTGAPGFNRDRGVEFPSVTVDRSLGANRGRVHVAWNESLNWYNDPLGGLGTQNEVESNNTAATANLFTPGRFLSGNLSPNTDQDWWRFAATAGVSYILVFPFNNVPANMHYSMEVICTDGVTKLALSGDITPSSQGGTGGGQGNIVFTAPTTATYYLRLAGIPPDPAGSYLIATGTNSVPGPVGERGRDQRDVFVATSTDGGATWLTPVRMNDDAALYDNWLPEVAVNREGYPYSMWFDFRNDAACGGSSDIYASRSTDGGATWAANQRVTTASTAWTTTLSNIAPNQGDYNGLYGGDVVGYAWGDGRLGDVDVFSAVLNTSFDAACPANPSADAGTSVDLPFNVTNNNVMFAHTLDYTLTSERNWPGLPLNGSFSFATGLHQLLLNVSVPDTAAGGTNRLCFMVSQPNNAVARACCTDLTITNSPVGVTPGPAAFSLSPARPNPVTAGGGTVIRYGLPRAGRASLRVYGTRGERVRTLLDGPQPADSASATWDLRDDAGREVPSGIYYVRLEFEGRSLQRRLVVIR